MGGLIIMHFAGLVVNIKEVRANLVNYLPVIFAFLNLIVILILLLGVLLLLQLLLISTILGLGRSY